MHPKLYVGPALQVDITPCTGPGSGASPLWCDALLYSSMLHLCSVFALQYIKGQNLPAG